MATTFLNMTKQMLLLHGVNASYTRASASVYDVATATAVNTSETLTVRTYPRHIKASQFNQPHLINKEAIEFYIAADSFTFEPKSKDKITYGGKTYVVDSHSEHTAHGEVCLYKIIAVRT
jgi:hypothetical protein